MRLCKMNAIDLLVDYAICMSTSGTITIPKGGNGEHDAPAAQCIGSTQNFKQTVATPPIDDWFREVGFGDWSRYNPVSSAQSCVAITPPKLGSLSNECHRSSTDTAMYTIFSQYHTKTPSCAEF